MSDAATEAAELDKFLEGNMPRSSLAARVAVPLVVAIAVFAAAWFGIALTRSSGRIASIWLANAIMVGAVLRRPPTETLRILSAGLIANVAANFASGDTLGMSLVLPILNQIEVIICTQVLNRFRDETGHVDLSRPRVLTTFCVLALGPSPLITAVLAAAYLSQIGQMSFAETVATWYPADALGLLALTPIILNLRRETLEELIDKRRLARFVGILVLYTAIVAVIFWQSRPPLPFMLFPFLVLVAFQAGTAGVIIAIGVTAGLSLTATFHGYGPLMLIEGDLRKRVFVLQLFLSVIALTAFEIAAVLAERDRFRKAILEAKDAAEHAQRERAESEARYRLIAERARDVIAQMTLDGTITYLSPSAELVTGYALADLVGTSKWSHIHPDDKARVAQAFEDLVAAGPQAPSPRLEYRFRHKHGPWIWLEINPRCLFDEADKPVGFLDIVRDVTARKLSDEELKLARAEAEAASRAKTEFLASMSHEIRTPLNGIIGYADLMLTDATLREDQRISLKRIETSGAALLAVVDDVLDFSRIEAGKVSLDPRPFSIAELVEESVSIVRNSADKKGLELSAVVADAIPPALLGDDVRIRQVVLNLLNNAIKFTITGRIQLTVDRERSANRRDIALRFTVEDTGVGIPSSRIERLFKRFSQGDESITRSYGGTGLGLAISRNLIELMGGAIGVESSEGSGSAFWFTVTLPEAEPEAAGLVHAAALPDRKARILLAEDTETNQALAIAVLEAAGHSVTVVPDGADAIMVIQEEGEKYDLILMDLQMPGTDGITATRRIRALDHPARNVPIIAMTANVLPKQIARMRAAGMDEHIGKPFKRDRLYAVIERAMNGRRLACVAQEEGETPMIDFDRETFDKIATLVGGARTLQLLASLTQMIEAFRMVLACDEGGGDMAKAAHKLVSAAGSLGFVELSRLCRELEHVLMGTTEGDAGALILRVREATGHALARIEALRTADPAQAAA